MELHDAIQELHPLATVPQHYPIMVELRCAASLLGLLSHDNTDISVRYRSPHNCDALFRPGGGAGRAAGDDGCGLAAGVR